jgi:hypothetical protein
MRSSTWCLRWACIGRPLRSASHARRASPASHDEAPAYVLRLYPYLEPACHPAASATACVTRIIAHFHCTATAALLIRPGTFIGSSAKSKSWSCIIPNARASHTQRTDVSTNSCTRHPRASILPSHTLQASYSEVSTPQPR